MGSEGMHPVGESRSPDDEFVIIGCPQDRSRLIKNIKHTFGDVEIIAPTELRRVRPRRKSSKRKVTYKSVPLFYEYACLAYEPIKGALRDLLELEQVWWVLMEHEKPLLVKRKRLGGMAGEDLLRKWEGSLVEFHSGAFVGQRGRFRGGKVELEILGKKTLVDCNPFNLVRL